MSVAESWTVIGRIGLEAGELVILGGDQVSKEVLVECVDSGEDKVMFRPIAGLGDEAQSCGRDEAGASTWQRV